MNTLDLSRNKLIRIENLEHMTNLEELWLGGNKIESYDDIQLIKILGNERDDSTPASLLTLYLEHNPIASDFEYRMRLKELAPSLTQIDATYCVASTPIR